MANNYCTNCGAWLPLANQDTGIPKYCPKCGREINPMSVGQSVTGDTFLGMQVPPNIQRKPFPTIGQGILLLIGLIAVVFMLFIFVGILQVITGVNFIKSAIVENLITLVASGIVLLIGFKLTKEPFLDIFPLKRFDIKIIFPLMVLIAGSTVLLSDIDNLFRSFFPTPDWVIHAYEDINSDPFKAIIIVVIIAPFTEEFFCRGLLLQGFLKNYSVNKAVIASALLFMFMHLNPWQFAGAFFYGLIFAWVVIKTKSLWPALIGHATANFIPTFIVGILGWQIPGFSDAYTSDIVMQPWWFDLTGLILLIVGFFWLRRLLTSEQENTIVHIR